MYHGIITTRRVDAEARVSLAKVRRWFADGDGDAGSNATPADNGGSGSGERMLPQSEVDRIVKDRVKRAGETAAERERQRILAELEIDDLAVAKQQLTFARQGSTLADELQAKIKALETERDDWAAKANKAEQFRLLDKRNAGLSRLAQAARADNVEDVLMLAEKVAADALKAALNDAGEFVEAEGQKVIDAVRAARPGWFKQPPGSPSNAGGRAPTTPSGKTPELGKQATFNL